MHFLVKVIVSALIIGVITEVAKHYSTIGGFIAALPLVSFTEPILDFFRRREQTRIKSICFRGIIWISCIRTIIIYRLYRFKNSFALSTSVLFGIGVWCIVSLVKIISSLVRRVYYL